MRRTEHTEDMSQDDDAPWDAERLLAYEAAKANGQVAAAAVPSDNGVREELECVDLLHRVWPDLEPNATQRDVQPKTLGDFRILREIGRGGMGTVFEAEQISMARHVALKVLPFAALVQEKSLQRFRNEVRAAAALDHPNIVSVYSVGEERGVHFYAMQLIRGETLETMIAELRRERCDVTGGETPTKIPSTGETFSTKRDLQARISTVTDARRVAESYRSAAKLAIQAAKALQHAHDQGILHRDIKPSNLLLDTAGKLYVTDFGLARMEADAGLTMTGDVIGTLRYMAPEQALAKRVVVDERADIYSLGATLYELLTLQPVFGETDRGGLLKQIAFDEPKPLQEIDRHIPAELNTIVLKAIAKCPDERYEMAQSFADDLRAFLEHRPIKAKPPGIAQRIAKWSRRHQAIVGVGAIALVLLSAVLAISMARVQAANRQANSALEDTARLLYTTDMKLACQEFESGRSDEAQTILDRHRPKLGQPDRRGFEWQVLQTLVEPPTAVALAAHEGPVNELAVFPDRNMLASVGNDGKLNVWDVRSGKLTRAIKICDDELHSVAISPDGKRIAIGSKAVVPAVYLCDLSDTDKVKDIYHAEYTAESLAFSADGKRIAVGTRYDKVSLISLVGQLLNDLPCASRNESLEFSRDGESLLLVNRRTEQENCGTAQLWRADLSKIERELDRSDGKVVGHLAVARLSPCGNFVIAGEERSSIAYLFNLKARKIVDKTHAARDRLTDLAFSPDGKAFAVSYRDGCVEIFNIRPDRDGRPLIEGRSKLLRTHDGEVCSLRFVDASTLATGGIDGLVRLWGLGQDRGVGFDLADVGMNSMALSPDGNLLLAVGQDEFTVIDMKAGNTVFRYSSSGGAYHGARWSPFSDRLAVGFTDCVAIFDPAGQLVCQIPHVGINDFAFSPNGGQIAIIGENQFQIADSISGQSLYQQPLEAVGLAVVFSHDGSQVAFGGEGGRINIFDPKKLIPLYEVPYTNDVHCLAFTPDGSLLVSGHADSMIRLWDTNIRQAQGKLAGHERQVTHLAISPDGHSLASLSRDETARLWSIYHLQGYGIFHRRPFLHRRAGAVYLLSVSLDGRKLAIGYENADQGFPDVMVWKIDPIMKTEPSPP